MTNIYWPENESEEDLREFVRRAQMKKMKEVWDNKYDEAWEKL
jgi:hypothetical protein